MRHLPLFVAIPVALITGCRPELDTNRSLIDAPAVLAVQAVPAEGAPGEAVSLTALFVAPDGSPGGTTLDWAYCLRQHAVADNRSVAPECLEGIAEWVAPVGTTPADGVLSTLLPDESCALFGSEPPPAPPGEPPARPTDPDLTGGYYQPVRVIASLGQGLVFGRLRVACALASVPVDVVRDFGERYVRNENPRVQSLGVAGGGASVGVGGTAPLVLTFDAASAEPYVVYDPEVGALLETRESLTAAFYTTAGRVDPPVAPAGDGTLSVTFVAPESATPVTLWAVLRDDRGGVAWATASISVQ